MTPDPVPALIVGGFLGSGKTTLVRHLVAEAVATGVRLAIISNEFGDTGIDKALLDSGQDGFVELDGGCVCCRLSDALPATVAALLERVRPDRVVLELSGIAFPGEVVVQFWRPPLSELVRDAEVVVVVDAERAAGPAGDDAADETFEEQLGAADRVVLNKRDRVDDAGVARARARVDAITGGRPMVEALYGAVPTGFLFADAPAPAPRAEVGPHDHDHDAFVSRELRFADGIREEALIGELLALDPLRAKGFVRTDRGVRLVQGVAGRLEIGPPPVEPPAELIGVVVVIDRA